MNDFLNIEDLLNEIELESERFARYKTPLSLVIFSFSFINKESQINYLHKVIFDFKKYLQKTVRKTDHIARFKNSIIVMLRNTDLDKAKGFLNRVFSYVDQTVKEIYKAKNSEVILVDVIVNIFIISFSNLIPQDSDNFIIFNSFDKREFVEKINSLDKIFETWELRLPLVDLSV